MQRKAMHPTHTQRLLNSSITKTSESEPIECDVRYAAHVLRIIIIIEAVIFAASVASVDACVARSIKEHGKRAYHLLARSRSVLPRLAIALTAQLSGAATE
eukprot:6214294-Pleurochrysis_carterae.AAC.1